MTRYRFNKSHTTRLRNVNLTQRSLLGFENINCSFGSEKSPNIAGGESVFRQLLAYKRDGRGKTLEVRGVYLAQLNVNNETQFTMHRRRLVHRLVFRSFPLILPRVRN